MFTNVGILSTEFAREISHGEKTQQYAQNTPASCLFSLPFIERYRNPRWSFTAAISVMEPVSRANIEAHTTDLGPGGCFVDTMIPFPSGTKVRLRMTKAGKSVEADGFVACSQVGVGMEISLTIVAPGNRATLDHWFAELRREVSPPPHGLEDFREVQSLNKSKTETEYAMEELIVTLVRKCLLSEEEGESILSRVLR